MVGPGSFDALFRIMSTIAVIAVAAMLIFGTPNKGQPAVVLPQHQCEQRLWGLRASLANYYAQYHAYPATISGLKNSGELPVEVTCPDDGGLYLYDPQKWPGRIVVCPNPAHQGY